MATIDPDGNFTITDRVKDVIKSGGEWISSIEVENVAVQHPAIKEAAVIGIADEKWGERPLLCVVPEPGADPSQSEIINWFSGKIAKWWIPQYCEFLPELPYTATGKVSKKDLRERFSRSPETSS